MDPRDKHSRQRPAVAAAAQALLRRLPPYVYLTDLWHGRRVLEIGSGDGAGAAYLAKMGAAQVIGLDRSSREIDQTRARQRAPNLSFAVADFAALDLDDRSVDVIFVPNGAELARWPAFLDEARRVLVREGFLVLTVPSADRAPSAPGGPAAMSYHDLLGRLAPVFGDVRMIGVTPFVGFALVEYAEAEVLDVELDTSLATEAARDPVTDYVAVAGAALGDPRGFMVVELPAADGLRAIGQARGTPVVERGELESRLADAEDAAADALARLAEIEGAGGKGRGEEQELRRRLARTVEERAAVEAEAQALRVRLGQADEEIGRVAAQAAREVGEARRQIQLASGRTETLEAQLAELRRELEARTHALDGAARLTEERRVQERRIQDLEATLRRRDEELAASQAEQAPLDVMARAAAQHQAEMRAKTMELAERDAYVEELRHELEEVATAERAAAEAAREASVRLAEVETEIRELRTRVATAEGEALRLRREAVAATEVGPDPRVAALEQALAEKTAATDKATARWKEAEGKSDELWRKIGELQKELGQTREQAVETARQQRQAAQIALTRAVDEASKKLVSSQDHAMRTEKERRELEREVGVLKDRLAEVERTQLEAEARLDGERSQARARAAQLETELSGARERAARTEADAAALRRELEAAEQAALARLDDEVARARAENEAAVAGERAQRADTDFEQARQRIAWLEVELGKPRTDPAVIGLRTELDHERGERLHRDEEIARLRGALEEARAEVTAVPDEPERALEALGAALHREEDDLRTHILRGAHGDDGTDALERHAGALAAARHKVEDLLILLREVRRSGGEKEVSAALAALGGGGAHVADEPR